MTERQQKRNAAGQGQRRKTARPEQVPEKSPKPARPQERRSPRMRKMRRKRVKSTIILVLFLMVVFVGAFGVLYVLRGGSISTPAQAYDITREFQHQSLVGTSQRASAFAADLCVVDGDQPMDSVSLEAGVHKRGDGRAGREFTEGKGFFGMWTGNGCGNTDSFV